ncbi:3-phosphoshikimate 1-carboxyvinyltransferase [Thermoflavifilum thermophilum]|uniref:3-phosphoshikimate 1-carboxyvinyltransferase n=1 Tax=Thermoflavifilum thermophilum TaxID=1393122 RepID=A0A1I7MZ12_9BACT|nr:3-phosphoshikimate 1-carboxyvinyltransferase [Thermoflavifilum thermophilum]SFV27659.1 3-phosphoshikimate 1-carboxyvinyltransferase [Thermoflavifilum thermophilum]
MEIVVSSSIIDGDIKANPSKSAMQRALAAALLAEGKTVIRNAGFSDDCRAAMGVVQALGADVLVHDQLVEVTSRGIHPRSAVIHCGEAGLCMRMFTPVAALYEGELTITGEGSLLKRPMHFFEEVLPRLGVSCETNQGLPPLRIRGPLQPASITVDGSLSSQFLTGLLMAFGAKASDAEIRVQDLKSREYVDLTLQIMDIFGVKVGREGYQKFSFARKQTYRPTTYTVEGDWSGAAFLLVAAAIAGKVTLRHLSRQSAQPDRAITQALYDAGAFLIWDDDRLTVQRHELRGFDFDATDCPDLFPPLVALAAHCRGITRLKGVNRLLHKESNRGKTLQEEFRKMGIDIQISGDEMLIKGGKIKSASVFSHHDHRIAMATAVAALAGTGEITVQHAEAVNKSYPEFWQHLSQIGGKIRPVQAPSILS